MSKAFFKNSKPDFEKRVFVPLGHRTHQNLSARFTVIGYLLHGNAKLPGAYGGPEVHKRVFRKAVLSFKKTLLTCFRQLEIPPNIIYGIIYGCPVR